MIFSLFSLSLNAQTMTVEELKAAKAELVVAKAAKDAEIEALQAESDAIAVQITELPGWQFGGLGTLGFNASQFTDWLGAENPNAASTSIGLSANAFANYSDPKQFWRNGGNLTFVRTKLVADKEFDGELPDSLQADFTTTADAVNLSSLYGYKLTEKWAISGLGEYRSTLKNLNDPGYLDIGVGATWTPIKDLVVVLHPLNYNFVFSQGDLQYESSLGMKFVADYSRALPMGIAWKSNLSGFLSYSGPADFSNWTWINGFSFTAWKGIGVGFEFGLRGNKQESFNNAIKSGEVLSTSDIGDLKDDFNPTQSYWLVGLTYNL